MHNGLNGVSVKKKSKAEKENKEDGCYFKCSMQGWPKVYQAEGGSKLRKEQMQRCKEDMCLVSS